MREHRATQQVAPQLPAQGRSSGIVRRALDAAIEAVVIVGSVTVVFGVGLVVLAAVAHEIGEREAVVHRNVVDAGARRAPIAIEQIARAGHARRDFADQRLARPITPQRVAETVVPLRPLRRKAAKPIAVRTDIPRLRDELEIGEQRLLTDRGKKRRVFVKPLRSAGEGGCEVEAEAVDITACDPVAQRGDHQLANAWMAEVERVAAAGKVLVETWRLWSEPIIRAVVDASKAQRRPSSSPSAV